MSQVDAIWFARKSQGFFSEEYIDAECAIL